MAVRKSKDGVWVADVVVGTKANGKPDRHIKRCKTKAQAKKAETQLLIQKELNKGKVSSAITFSDFVDTVYWPQKKYLRGNTIKGYKADIRLRLNPAFGNTLISDINRLGIQKMIDSCPSEKTGKKARETLSSILSLAVDMGMIAINPAKASYRYPQKTKHPEDYYGVVLGTFEEHRTFLQRVRELRENQDVERMCVLGLCFGLRTGEIFGLDWENVDLEKREIHIVQTYVRGEEGAFLAPPKTPRSTRTIPMTAYAHERLSEWWEIDMHRNGPIVRNIYRKRTNPQSARDKLKYFIDHNTYDDGTPLQRVTLFSMRHSFGTSWVNAGFEISKLSAILGHCDVATTYNSYVRPRQKDLRVSMDAIDAIFG